MAYQELFTLSEFLSLMGLFQSVYILVYMLLRSGNWRYAVVPVGYFLFLACAFFLDAAASRWEKLFDSYDLVRWGFWMGTVPLGTLLIFQVALSPLLPRKRFLLLLLLIPLSLMPAWLPDMEMEAVYVAGLVAGAISLLTIWLSRGLLSGLSPGPDFRAERFWLILALIITNTAFLASTFAYVSQWMAQEEWVLVRNALGIGFAYIAATSLFRIYPQAVLLSRRGSAPQRLSDEEAVMVSKIEALITSEKVYQQPSYGRTEMARDLGVGEAALSRVVNVHYGKTIPQLLNDYRVLDAQYLLRETDIPVSHVFQESGFNSLTTFNRVFKELTGVSPSEYRGQRRRS